jgi:hypothetical protein
VEIDDDLDADFVCPPHTLIQIVGSALSVRSVGVVKCPESDWDPDHVEAAVSDLLEVLECDPVLPVRSQDLVGCCFCSESLCESVLVDDTTRAVELLENRWSYPGLKDEPASEVDSSNLFVSPRERRITRESLVDDASVNDELAKLCDNFHESQLTAQLARQ